MAMRGRLSIQATDDWDMHDFLCSGKSISGRDSRGSFCRRRGLERHTVHCISVKLDSMCGKHPHNGESWIVLDSDVVID